MHTSRLNSNQCWSLEDYGPLYAGLSSTGRGRGYASLRALVIRHGFICSSHVLLPVAKTWLSYFSYFKDSIPSPNGRDLDLIRKRPCKICEHHLRGRKSGLQATRPKLSTKRLKVLR